MTSELYKNLSAWIAQEIKEKGFNTLLLLVAVYFLYNQGLNNKKEFDAKIDKVETQLIDCQSELMNDYKSGRTEMIDILKQNNKLLEENTRVLRDL